MNVDQLGNYSAARLSRKDVCGAAARTLETLGQIAPRARDTRCLNWRTVNGNTRRVANIPRGVGNLPPQSFALRGQDPLSDSKSHVFELQHPFEVARIRHEEVGGQDFAGGASAPDNPASDTSGRHTMCSLMRRDVRLHSADVPPPNEFHDTAPRATG